MAEPERKLDDKGRCCGRKPTPYKGRYAMGGPHRVCLRCSRAYHLTENEQIPNWAWSYSLEGWTREGYGKVSHDH